MLVHHPRFPCWPRNDLDLPYFGPYLMKEVGVSTLKVKASPSMGGFLDVGYNQVKRYTAIEDDDLETWKHLAAEAERSKAAADEDEKEGVLDEEQEAPQLREMNEEEMKEQDCYTVEPILQHKYKHSWRFLFGEDVHV